MSQRGKPYAVVSTQDRTLDEVQRRLWDVLDQLEDHRRGMLVSSVLVVSGTTTLGEQLAVVYTGSGGHTLRLPPASLRGSRRGQVLFVANQGTGVVTLVPSGVDTLNGNAPIVVNGTTVLYSDGASKWHEVAGNGDLLMRRIHARNGTPLTTADFVLSAGWGTTASLAFSAAGLARDMRGTIIVTSAGVGQAANPTITLNFKDGAFPEAPSALVARNGGNQPAVLPTWGRSVVQLLITFPGTPVAGETYNFSWMLMG